MFLYQPSSYPSNWSLFQGELSTFGNLTRPSETECQIDTAKSASQVVSRILVQLSDLAAGYFDYSGEYMEEFVDFAGGQYCSRVGYPSSRNRCFV